MSNKLHMLKKQQLSTVTIVLLLTTTIAMVGIPVAFGDTPTQCFVAPWQKKIGLGETMWVSGWVSPLAPTQGDTYHDLRFVFTKPDETQFTINIAESGVEATMYTNVVCDQEGEWSVVLEFDGEYDRLPSISPPNTWIVEEGYVPPEYPTTELPDYPWSYPISSEYHQWYQISGAWLASHNIMTNAGYNASGTSFNPYSEAPNSPHILWKKALIRGGLYGGEEGEQGAGNQPTGFVSALGRIFYTQVLGYGDTRRPVLFCLDIKTGEQIYALDLPSDPEQPGTGGTLAFEIDASKNVFSLWVMGGGLWEVEPWNGQVLYYLSYSHVGGRPPAGTYANGAIYLHDYPEWTNITKFNTRTKQIDWTMPTDPSLIFTRGPGRDPGANTRAPNVYGDYMIMHLGAWHGRPFHIITYNATTGEMIVNGTEADYASATTNGVAAYGRFYMHLYDRRVHAFDIVTGDEVWKSDPQEYPWGAFVGYWGAAAYGYVYSGSHDGYLYCYDGETGATVWKHFSENTNENAFGTYPWWGQVHIADGKLYASTGVHTPLSVVERGDRLYCLDAKTGDEIWRLDGVLASYSSGGISSGVLFYPNRYDACLYAIGQGESKTTVSAPQAAQPLGTGVLISGTVTDQSAGAEGTPAISDEDMNEWMQYLYMNKPAPSDATGVEVTIDVIDPNNEYRNIGKATSDSNGFYSLLWEPDILGKYTVIATFDGSDSYYPSCASTAFAVQEVSPGQPQETEPPTTEPPTTEPPTGAPFPTEIAIIAAVVAVAVIGIAAYWILRRRK